MKTLLEISIESSSSMDEMQAMAIAAEVAHVSRDKVLYRRTMYYVYHVYYVYHYYYYYYT